MDDGQILERGGTEENIREYAEANGADLTGADVFLENKLAELEKVVPEVSFEFCQGHKDDVEQFLRETIKEAMEYAVKAVLPDEFRPITTRTIAAEIERLYGIAYNEARNNMITNAKERLGIEIV